MNRSHSYEYPVNAIVDVMFPTYNRKKSATPEEAAKWESDRDKAAHSFEDVPFTAATFEYVLFELNETEREAIHLYYRDGLTTKKIAEQFGLSVSRAGQIIHDAWRHLRYPSRLDKIKLGLDGYYKKKADAAYLKGHTEGYDKGYSDGYKAACELSATEARTALDAVPDTPLEDLDLSVRTYNCLKRGGVNTLKRLAKKDPESIARIRNLGKRSYEEIVDMLQSYGVDTKAHKEVLNNFAAVIGVKSR